MTLQELNTEITTGPFASSEIQWDTWITESNWDLIANVLNDVTKGGQIDKERVTAVELQSAIVASEFIAITNAPTRELWQSFIRVCCSNGSLPIKNTNLRAQIAAIFGPATTTRANMVALQTRQGSRAEVLWGDGFKVTPQDVFNAMEL